MINDPYWNNFGLKPVITTWVNLKETYLGDLCNISIVKTARNKVSDFYHTLHCIKEILALTKVSSICGFCPSTLSEGGLCPSRVLRHFEILFPPFILAP